MQLYFVALVRFSDGKLQSVLTAEMSKLEQNVLLGVTGRFKQGHLWATCGRFKRGHWLSF